MDLRFQRFVQSGVCLFVTLVMATGAGAADKPKKEMRESATLPADNNLLKQFKAIEDYLSEKRWVEAIDLLQQIVQTDGRLLVRAQPGAPGGSAVYLNVSARCNILLAELPAEGLAVYRKKVDAQARRWLDRWKQTHDEADLQRVVREAYLSSSGDEALFALGESAWDRGDLATARQYWTQLCPLGQEAREQPLPTVLRYPDRDMNLAEVLARLVLCTLMEGEYDLAVTEQTRFQELYPDAEGTLAGRTGRLSDLLTKILDEAKSWDVRQHSTNVATFGMNARRGGTYDSAVEIGASKWSRPLPATLLKYPERTSAPLDQGPLSYFPVTFEDIVLVNNSRSIFAWNAVTGEPAWPTDRGTAEIYPPAPDDVTGLPDEVCNGVPWYTMTVADGRLYARMGSVVTNPSDKEHRPSDSDLVCLDLAHGQGKLVWKTSSDELFKVFEKPKTGRPPGLGRSEDANWRFEGAPLVLGGRAYVALSRRQPQFDFAIACLDAATGTLLWHRTVVYARGTVEDHQNRISHLLLTAGAGKLFLSTDSGAIVAVDAQDGRLAWAVTYESISRNYRSVAFSNHLQLGLLPPLFHEGLLFVAPNDCSRVFCIEADSGRVRWQHKHSDPESNRWRHLLGVARGGVAGRLIVSGKSLSAIDIETNKVAYAIRTNSLGSSSSEAGYGRGVLAGKIILWPTREAIKIVDAENGTIVENKPLQTPDASEVGGNLTISQGMLLVAQPYRLVAYCEYSLLKQRLEKELSLRATGEVPTTAIFGSAADNHLRRLPTSEVLGQLADIEYAQGNTQAAVEVLRKAMAADHATGQPDRQALSRSRGRLVEMLRQAGKAASAEEQWKVAAEHLKEARKLATQPADLVAILKELADAEVNLGRPVAAVDCWQQILDSDRLRDTKFDTSNAGTVATAEISKLIQQRGPAVYAEVEHRAKSEVAALLEADDVNGLRQTLQRYPNSEVAFRTWRRLAVRDRRDGRYEHALASQARLLGHAKSLEDQALALVDWAETLESAGYWRSARAAWKQLGSSKFADQVVDYDQSKQRVASVASRHLENAAYKSYEPNSESAGTAQYLDRAWSIRLPDAGLAVTDGAVVLVPRNDPPASNLACLLIQSSDVDPTRILWECIDRATGQVRWQRPLPSSPQWIAYSETHLLVATQTHLLALSLETGSERWAIPLTKSADSPEHRVVIVDEKATGAADAKTAELVRIFLRDHWVVLFDSNTGVTIVDSRTGQFAWTFKPPRGRLQPQCVCGSQRVAIQTTQPSVTWLLNLDADCQSIERPGSGEPWSQAILDDDDHGLITVSPERRIEYRSTEDGRNRWRYKGGMSFAHVDPVLWSAGEQLLLTVDGTTLAQIEPLTGRALWASGIADLPLIDPATQVIATSDAAFAASNGSLRRVALKYGDCQWERFLGSVAEQWRVADCHGLIAAWPTASSAKESPRQSIVWCDARSGRILQQMNIAKGDRVSNVTADSKSCLVVTDRTIVAFRAGSEARE